MQPNRDGTPIFELPPEQPETPAEQSRPNRERSAEQTPARAEKAASAGKQPALPTIPDDIPAADTPLIAAPADDEAADTVDPHQAAPQSDHIEPEWVNKAKAIISQTRDDPYQQKHEMSKIKAEYIRKRFGKNIKTDEAAA